MFVVKSSVFKRTLTKYEDKNILHITRLIHI